MKAVRKVGVIVTAIVATAIASASSEVINLPAEVKKDAERGDIGQVYKSVASLPPGLKESLRKIFRQKRLLMAEPDAQIRETDVVTAADAQLQTRRFVVGFSTRRFQYIYYRAAGYENAGKLLIFVRHGSYYQRVWSGVEFNTDPMNPSDVLARVRHRAFDEKKDFFW